MGMKGKMAIMAAAALLQLSCGIVFAADAWQADIKIGVQNAEIRLVVGQSPDATDGIDGAYDIPALLAGDIQSCLILEGKEYWKDIKSSSGNKTWDFTVESELAGKDINIKWNPARVPSDMKVMLTDMNTGTAMDMRSQSGYTYQNTGKRQFSIKTVNLEKQ
jgi:hypothetical protein